MKQIEWVSKQVNVAAIAPTPTNYKIKTKLGMERLRESLKSFGLAGNVVCNYAGKFGDISTLVLIDGNSRREEAVENGVKKLWVSLPSRSLSPKEFKEMSAMFDVAKAGEVDMDRIKTDLGTSKTFYDKYRLEVPLTLLDTLGAKNKIEAPEAPEREMNKGALREKFIEPPFSVLDTKHGSWQTRKAEWLKLGIQSELGRESGKGFLNPTDTNYMAMGKKKGAKAYNITPQGKSGGDGTTNAGLISIFDPVLCELMYTWFCKSRGAILDPFAGGSVRGIVANYLGFQYTGIELSERQVVSNREQAASILKKNNQPVWYFGDSDKALDKKWAAKFDMIFSCPPYVDLEVYSNHKDDLSNMNYADFLTKYESIITKSIALLKPKGYACFVVGEVRDKKGFYYDFVGETKRIFVRNGTKFLNDAVLLNAIGSAPVRAGKFDTSKKLVKVHQNVLVFYKP